MKFLLCVALLIGIVLTGLAAAPAQAAGPNDYIVQPGDTLYAIADRYGVNVNDLAAINGLSTDPAIYAGQALAVPPLWPAVPQFGYNNPPTYPAYAPQPMAQPQMWNQPAAAAQPGGGGYVIQPGDTLFGLAQRYGVSVADLQAVNGLSDFSPIIAGQSLALPGAASTLLTQPALPAPPTWNTPDYAQPYPAQPTWGTNPSPNFYNAPVLYPQPAKDASGAERWIDVDLTHQTLTAFEGQTPVYTSRVSTGLAQYPTVAGTFEIYVKYEAADMSGGAGADAYYLRAVPYVMYFHDNYGLHGTYWHNNFGTPMSHGCVNLPTPDAQWLFNWASIGTKVVTHY